MEAGLISQGLDLMLYGMGTVFVFLTVLVGSTTLMSALVSRFFPEATIVETSHKPSNIPAVQSVDTRTLKVIQEAIYQHQANTK